MCVVMGRVCGFMYAGIIFNTRVVVGYVVVCGVVEFLLLLWVYFFLPMRLWSVLWCGDGACLCLFTRVLFLIPARWWGRCVWCGSVPSFVVGLLFSTRVVGGVRVLWGGACLCLFTRVLFLILARWWCRCVCGDGAWLFRFFAGIIFNTRVVVECVFCGAGCDFLYSLWVYFFSTRVVSGVAACVMGRVCGFMYAGLLFSTRVVGGADVCVMWRSNTPLIGALRAYTQTHSLSLLFRCLLATLFCRIRGLWMA